mgnify:FL=1
MQNTRNVTDSVIWVGANDRRIGLFENLFPVEKGVSYNSYVILDEKTAVMDTADAAVTLQFLDNVRGALGGRELDYIVVNHMEPDHCANIEMLMRLYPGAKVVGNAKTFQFIRQFYEMDLEGRTVEVKEGDVLDLGYHKLQFVFAPMVHWPEVMMAYDQTEKLLFSADAFGSFGALDALFNDEQDCPFADLAEMRRYFSNIVGKYGPQVQAVLKKAAGLEISAICPLHGQIWRTDIAEVLKKHDQWSRYEAEEKAVAIFYASMYGNTAEAAETLAAMLAEAGVKNTVVYDVSRTHVSYLISEIFRCSNIVLAAPTYNNGLYPAMLNLLEDMKALNLQNRTVSIIENGSWAPQSGKIMREMVSSLKGMNVSEKTVTIKSSVKEEQRQALKELCGEICASLEA